MTTGNARRVDNKRARFDYEISETFEAGLVLRGSEVKSMRAGQANLNAAFVRPLQSGAADQAELWLVNGHFAQTEEPDRSRKLLVHRKEISRLLGKIQEKGLTLVPLAMYFSRGKIKIEVGLAKGKKQFEKREAIKKRDVDREMRGRLKP
jgi:SsrA-binding protein